MKKYPRITFLYTNGKSYRTKRNVAYWGENDTEFFYETVEQSDDKDMWIRVKYNIRKEKLILVKINENENENESTIIIKKYKPKAIDMTIWDVHKEQYNGELIYSAYSF